MWTGWNVINSTNVLQKQIVCYIKPIQLPHTRTDVVKETIKRSIDIANIVKQRLQKEYNLKNPQPVITFLLCLDLSFFSSLRKFIEGSSGPYILSKCDIVAIGSMNKFLKGKMYSRCGRGNMILAVSMEGLHFERFLNENYFDDKEAILEEFEAYTNTDQKIFLKK